jgi:RNA polymerase sigma-B factor
MSAVGSNSGRPVGRAAGRAEADDAGRIQLLFEQYRARPDRHTRNRLVEAHLHLADYYVARFARSGNSPAEDLRQTALLAVLNAVERFDPSMGVSFRTFASRTIEGELKRYLRDRSWAVRPPRRAQELHLLVRRTAEELTHRLGRAPTVAELAEDMRVDDEHVLEALEAGQARSATGIDAPAGPNDDLPLARLLGSVDPSYGTVDERMVLRSAVAALDERQQLVLHLRFVEELSQPEIAERIGVSQSYVSRILRGSLALLRTELSPT